jgi:hypothetical protein
MHKKLFKMGHRKIYRRKHRCHRHKARNTDIRNRIQNAKVVLVTYNLEVKLINGMVKVFELKT